ncbi:MAG: glycosyltransferase family 2 protein [Clostridiales bacterium]|nr:glycosyltransferase family 2 protein [Clostridiales bacterium]
MKQLTVCVCAYNAAKYLEETLSSIEKQKFSFEYLLIDDGSSDDTVQIMEKLKRASSHKVTLKTMEENRGTAYCRNWAIHHVNTELIMFFDSDDIAGDSLIGQLYSEIEKDEKCIAVSCYSKYIDENGKFCGGGAVHRPHYERRISAKSGKW